MFVCMCTIKYCINYYCVVWYLPEEVGHDSYCFKEECACTDKIYRESSFFS